MHDPCWYSQMQFLVHLFGGNPRLKHGTPGGILQLTKIRIEQVRGSEFEVEEKAVGGAYADLWSPNPRAVGGQEEGGSIDLSRAPRCTAFQVWDGNGVLVSDRGGERRESHCGKSCQCPMKPAAGPRNFCFCRHIHLEFHDYRGCPAATTTATGSFASCSPWLWEASCHQSQAHSYVGTVTSSAHGARKLRAVVFGGAAAEEASKLPPSARCRLIRLAS